MLVLPARSCVLRTAVVDLTEDPDGKAVLTITGQKSNSVLVFLREVLAGGTSDHPIVIGTCLLAPLPVD